VAARVPVAAEVVEQRELPPLVRRRRVLQAVVEAAAELLEERVRPQEPVLLAQELVAQPEARAAGGEQADAEAVAVVVVYPQCRHLRCNSWTCVLRAG
jgi:hypothetical protein